KLHPIQEGFWEKHGLQCGFCTPGMIMSAHQMLQRNPRPTEAQIRHDLEGNLCRCTGYHNIVKAIQYAAEKMAGKEEATMDTGRLLGASIKRREDPRFITGKGNYTDDLKLAGMTHAVFVRSPHANAKIRKIDIAAASKAPGVVKIFTGK